MPFQRGQQGGGQGRVEERTPSALDKLLRGEHMHAHGAALLSRQLARRNARGRLKTRVSSCDGILHGSISGGGGLGDGGGGGGGRLSNDGIGLLSGRRFNNNRLRNSRIGGRGSFGDGRIGGGSGFGGGGGSGSIGGSARVRNGIGNGGGEVATTDPALIAKLQRSEEARERSEQARVAAESKLRAALQAPPPPPSPPPPTKPPPAQNKEASKDGGVDGVTVALGLVAAAEARGYGEVDRCAQHAPDRVKRRSGSRSEQLCCVRSRRRRLRCPQRWRTV